MTTWRSEARNGLGADVAVVGAGPAGLASAVTAADGGATVLLVDGEAGPGGQYWRHPAPAGGVGPEVVAKLHHDLPRYRDLVRRLDRHRREHRIRYLPGHQVWALSAEGAREDSDPSEPVPPQTRFVGHAVPPGGTAEIRLHAGSIVLAPGAYDLQIPFPGWDLPGVLTAGGAQSLLKGHDVVPGRRVLVAGTGPFLLSVAAGLARSGATVVGVYEAASPTNWRHGIGAVARNLGKLSEGAGYAWDLARNHVPFHARWTVLAAHGDDQLRAVTVAPLGRGGRPDRARARRIQIDTLAVGWGFVPQLELPLALGCATTTASDGSLIIDVGVDQQTSVPGVYVAGEACGIGGAALAVIEGQIAGIAVAQRVRQHRHDRGDRHDQYDPHDRHYGHDQHDEHGPVPAPHVLFRRRNMLRSFANAMLRAYPVPANWMDELHDDTVVCRCEEVTAGTIRDVVRRDAVGDARSVRLLARTGMGWCQGRVCGYAAMCLSAAWSGGERVQQAVERPVAVPVSLGVVASGVAQATTPSGSSER